MKTVALLLSSLMLTAAAHANEPAAASAKPDLAKGGAISTQVCVACHTADGSRGAPANPIIAGQHPEYLAKQLHEFKSGKRKNAIMSGMAAPLSEEDIRNVSAFYASKTAKPGFAKNKATVALGEKIYRGGIADRNIPACAGCHGPTGSGMPAQYPRLGGQHGDYIDAQMTAFRAGTRANAPMMTAIAAKMNDKEIKAVSDYIAGLR
ncbi:c-type cytochrome [Roseateles sp. DC23W]|uniref:C-type cytochrome n=1 Tax=Pelomonas dachongensis TaxID=3299029 RepID=A0ABW7ETS4_9BURK